MKRQILTALLCVTTTLIGLAQAAPRTKPAQAGPRSYRSPHFLLHTDVTEAKRKELLKKLERMLKLISAYWGRPCSGSIECYVVKDLSKWRKGVIPPKAQAKIIEGAGVTLSETLRSADKFLAKATVYSCAEGGVVQHEVVHAYCTQSFGRTGPTWYSEGMAEMGQYFHHDDCAVNIEPDVLRYLQGSKPQSMASIVDPKQYTGDSWQNYAWRWVLCHMLANNPNYAPRFRPLGQGILLGQEDSTFVRAYGDVANEISFEYLFFLEHICQGFRVDLCAFDWSKKFKPLNTSARRIAVKLVARRGWQPTGLTVKKGHQYSIKAKGKWKPDKKTSVDADGDSKGKGRLVGALMEGWELGKLGKLDKPFPLGKDGTFIAQAEGNLYLRCNDEWSDVADNSGAMSVTLKFVSKEAEPGDTVYTPRPEATGTEKTPPFTTARPRTWTNITGRYKIEAVLVGIEGKLVRLRKTDGKVVSVPMSKLSDADREYLESRKRKLTE